MYAWVKLYSPHWTKRA